jgi:hypothetical protein
MKLNWMARLLSVSMVIWMVGCNLGSSSDTTRGGEPVYPPCDPNYMVSPSLISPQGGSTVNTLQPNFEWAYPGYYIANGPQQQGHFPCTTEAFHISLSSGPFFQDELGATVGGVPGFNTLYTRTWMPSTPLHPGWMYRWEIRPFSQGIEGPVSEVRYFFIGPHCDPAALVAPTLLTPNHWIFNDLANLSLVWWYPGECLPDGYNVEVSDSLVFDGSPLNGSMDNPSTRWGPLPGLVDCTRYYWRVQPVRQGQTGPYSQVYTFRLDLNGSCAPETNGMIQGTLWQDQCVGPGPGTPVPDPLPLGCVLQNGNQLFTNQTYDPGEPGIPGLIVNLGDGACPSKGYRYVETGSDGMFNFYELPAGTYCASLSSNSSILLPGAWTYPPDAVNQPIASQTITVAAGQDVKNVNFGWWYEFGNPWGSQTASVFGNVWHDTCAYTPGDPIPDPLPKGCVLDNGTVHADGIRAPDEPGIPGVYVKLGAYTCPSSGLAVATTDADGYFTFGNLPPGHYCIRIENADNQQVLLAGRWTVVAGVGPDQTYRAITLTAGSTLSGQDFGWDYDNLPTAATPAATALPVQPIFTLTSTANCREGPDVRYRAVTSFPAEKSFPIAGKSQDGLWYFVQAASTRCWFAGSLGSTSGDLSGLKVFYGPPLPTDTPILACSTHKDKTSCEAAACKWAPSTAGPGVCKPK